MKTKYSRILTTLSLLIIFWSPPKYVSVTGVSGSDSVEMSLRMISRLDEEPVMAEIIDIVNEAIERVEAAYDPALRYNIFLDPKMMLLLREGNWEGAGYSTKFEAVADFSYHLNLHYRSTRIPGVTILGWDVDSIIDTLFPGVTILGRDVDSIIDTLFDSGLIGVEETLQSEREGIQRGGLHLVIKLGPELADDQPTIYKIIEMIENPDHLLVTRILALRALAAVVEVSLPVVITGDEPEIVEIMDWLHVHLEISRERQTKVLSSIRGISAREWVAKEGETHNYTIGAIAGTDDLGRVLPDYKEVGPLRDDRYVGVFYFVWHGEHTRTGPHNVTNILEQDPTAVYDIDHPLWGPVAHYHHWGEPLFGYYFFNDAWVIRRHIEMLTLAGADFLVLDTTNHRVYKDNVLLLLEILEEYRQLGWKVPQVAFYTNTNEDVLIYSGPRIETIYEVFYRPGLYPKLWFRWEDKPLIIGHEAEVTEEIREFFTFRESQWPTESKKEGGFPWICFERPQRIYYNEQGEKEVISVSVAQNSGIIFSDTAFYGVGRNRGRSFHLGSHDLSEGSVNYGYNFQEQWEFALRHDPQIIFVTSWNEWVAMIIRGSEERPVIMFDSATQEFSSDIEPMQGGHFDNYYLQFIANVRRFKGLPEPPSRVKTTIEIEGCFTQWAGVETEYRDFVRADGQAHRDGIGFGGIVYRNETERNNFGVLKVTHDDTHIYFYVRSRGPIDLTGSNNSLQLFLNIRESSKDNWEGYQYLANVVIDGENKGELLQSTGGWNWNNVGGIACRLADNEVHLAVPREWLDIENTSFVIEFKWADNVSQSDTGLITIEDFYLHGDTAPFGRFNFVY